MIINHISADGYKNLDGVDIELDERLNILSGRNAQGKTNLVEAVWLCTGCRSFRLARDRSFIGFEKEKASVSVDFTDSVRKQEIFFEVRKGKLKEKNITLNGVKLPLMSRLFGNLKCVIFTPDDLSMLKGPPENRRSFADLSASQLKPSFVSALNKYNSLLAQRNSVIKKISMGKASFDDLDIWDVQLASTGAYISVVRHIFCSNLSAEVSEIYDKISDGNEKMTLEYCSTVFGRENVSLSENTDHNGELKDIYYQRLVSHRNDDVRVGYTLCGTHRDDISVRINGLDVREFGSQGQQRSAAIAMKSGQALLIRKQTGDPPVMLLDDVLSELDDKRKKFILQSNEDMQIIITCCDEKYISENSAQGKIFQVASGKISERI